MHYHLRYLLKVIVWGAPLQKSDRLILAISRSQRMSYQRMNSHSVPRQELLYLERSLGIRDFYLDSLGLGFEITTVDWKKQELLRIICTIFGEV